MNMNQLIAAVRGVVRDREIARLMPATTSHKTEATPQRRNPARAAKKAARRAKP